jgi:ankyrin repeat protein
MNTILKAYKQADMIAFEALLKKENIPNLTEEELMQLCSQIIIENNTNAAKLLLHPSTNLNNRIAAANFLHGACKWGGLEMVELLLKNGSDPNLVYENVTPLILRYSDKVNLKITKLLIAYKANYLVTDKEGNNLLMLICSTNALNRYTWYRKIFPSLFRVKIVYNDDFMNEQLMLEKELIQYLFEQQFDFNQQNNNEQTALHFAFIERRLDLAAQLLQCNANPNIEDKLGRSPYYYALHAKEKNFVALFEQYGGKLAWWYKPFWKWTN